MSGEGVSPDIYSGFLEDMVAYLPLFCPPPACRVHLRGRVRLSWEGCVEKCLRGHYDELKICRTFSGRPPHLRRRSHRSSERRVWKPRSLSRVGERGRRRLHLPLAIGRVTAPGVAQSNRGALAALPANTLGAVFGARVWLGSHYIEPTLCAQQRS